jgi:hypothetical protein
MRVVTMFHRQYLHVQRSGKRGQIDLLAARQPPALARHAHIGLIE